MEPDFLKAAPVRRICVRERRQERTRWRQQHIDQIYPSNHALDGLVDLFFGWRNLRDFKVGLEASPAKKLTVRGAVHDLNLANAHDGLYNGLGNLVVRKSDGSAGTDPGQELEGLGGYSFTRCFAAEIGYGHLFPGEFIR